MSVQQHSATSSLLAVPSVQADPSGKPFTIVQRAGYHKGEVDEWTHWALDEIDRARREVERLTRQAAAYLAQEAESPQGRKLIAELIMVAADEITGQQAAAAAEIAEMIAGAQEQAQGIVADARRQADAHIASASQQASALVENARADAKATTDAATAHAAGVHEAVEQRMAAFLKVHEDGLLRMSQMNDVTGKYMEAERARGSLRDELDRALAAIQQRR